jgi:predicted RNA-binding Zn-ribbon protein involved in translation (DUF1610 family)
MHWSVVGLPVNGPASAGVFLRWYALRSSLVLIRGSEMTNRKGSEVCPRCGEDTLVRVPRRLIERLVSVVRPVRRYKCWICGWRGTVRVRRLEERKGLEERKEPTLRS